MDDVKDSEGRGPEDPGFDPGPDPADPSASTKDGNVTHLPKRNGAPLGDTDAEDGEEELDPEDQLALFVVEDGKELSLGQLRKRGTPIEIRFTMTGKSIPASEGGLLDPYATSHLLVADCVIDHIKPQYIRDSAQRVEKVILYQVLKPRIVQQATSARGKEMIQAAEELKAQADAA